MEHRQVKTERKRGMYMEHRQVRTDRESGACMEHRQAKTERERLREKGLSLIHI